MDPVPLKSEKEYGDTPPVPEKLMVELINTVCASGDIAKAAFTVTRASLVAPKLSVTRIVASPAAAGAVYTPVVAFTTPVPLTRE